MKMRNEFITISKKIPNRAELVDDMAQVVNDNFNIFLDSFNNKNPEESLYKDGVMDTWLFVNLSLFKMWKDSDLLDFEALHCKLKENYDTMLSDENLRIQLQNELIVFIKEKGWN